MREILQTRDVAEGALDEMDLAGNVPFESYSDMQDACVIFVHDLYRMLGENKPIVLMTVEQYEVAKWALQAACDENNTEMHHQLRASLQTAYNSHFED